MSNTNGPNIGPIIKSAREQAHLTQTELDKLLGMKPGYISKLESKAGITPNPQVINGLVRVLGLNRERVLNVLGYAPDPNDTMRLDYDLKRLAAIEDMTERKRVWWSLPPEERALFRAVFVGLIDLILGD